MTEEITNVSKRAREALEDFKNKCENIGGIVTVIDASHWSGVSCRIGSRKSTLGYDKIVDRMNFSYLKSIGRSAKYGGTVVLDVRDIKSSERTSTANMLDFMHPSSVHITLDELLQRKW